MDRPVAGIVPFSVAIVGGVLSWDLVRLFGDRSEAWDDPIYWQLAFPLMLFTAMLLGAACRDRPWRWVAAMVGAQAAWAILISVLAEGMPSLFPLGLLMFAFIALPCLAAAYGGKWLVQRLAK